MVKRLCALILIFIWAAVLSGCNTARGFGKDLQKAGEAIQRSAD